MQSVIIGENPVVTYMTALHKYNRLGRRVKSVITGSIPVGPLESPLSTLACSPGTQQHDQSDIFGWAEGVSVTWKKSGVKSRTSGVQVPAPPRAIDLW